MPMSSIVCYSHSLFFFFFFFNDTATTEIYTLSLHDALPILADPFVHVRPVNAARHPDIRNYSGEDRKSTRLNSSHMSISYAVFCLKKKKKNESTSTACVTTSLVASIDQ